LLVIVIEETTPSALRRNRGFETRSLPSSLAATRRGFTFYLAGPASSVHE